MDTVRKEALLTLMGEKHYYVSYEMPAVSARHTEWNDRDKAFYAALVETCVERRTTIDAVIAAYSRTRLSAMESAVRYVLRLALAQILFMDRVPDSAAVNESVKLIKSFEKGRAGRLSGFVNGILRNIIREKQSLQAKMTVGRNPVRLRYTDGRWKVQDKKNEKYESSLNTALCCSFPYWLVRFFEEKYPGKHITEGLSAERKITCLTKDGQILFFDKKDHPADTNNFRNGSFYIMDLSSMQPVIALKKAADVAMKSGSTGPQASADPLRKPSLLDLCAAPGGKSIESVILLDAEVTACDNNPARLERMKENITRMRMEHSISLLQNDAALFNPAFEEKYDIVLADCPCSGLGVSGRKPDIRLNITPKAMKDLALLQKQILENACRYVKTGGTLLYSTCTLNPDENENQATAFSAGHPEFTLLEQKTIFPDELHDGFYYALFARTAHEKSTGSYTYET